MDAHPQPVLKNLALPFSKFDSDLFRVSQKINSPVFFGRTGTCRFDSPDSQYGVLYSALDSYGAFIETFGHKTGVKLVQSLDLTAREIAVMKSSRPMMLVDLTGKGLAQIGADGRLCSGGDYALAQDWSRAIFEHHSKPDGIYYRSRHDPSKFCVAVFERAGLKIDVVRKDPLDPAVCPFLPQLLDHYKFGIV